MIHKILTQFKVNSIFRNSKSPQLLSVLALYVLSAVASPGDAWAAGLEVLNLSEQNLRGKNQICARFSESLDTTKDIQSYFSVSKKGGELADGAWLFSNKDRLACFGNSEPSNDYKVIIYKRLPAKSGSSLAKTFQSSIATRSLDPVVSFDTRGSVLMPGVSQGLPVASVNIPAVDITFHRVKASSREEVLDEITSGYTYSLSRQLDQFSELVYTGRFDLPSEENTRKNHTISIGDIKELKRPGLYLAVMKAAGSYTDSPKITHFSVTDLGLHARIYVDRLDVHVNSLISAKAVAGVTLSLIDDKGQILKQTRSTKEGFGSFRSPPQKAVLLLAEKQDHQTLLRLKGPALDLSDFQLGDRPQEQQTLFIYSERDLYRPGERVHFSGLLRNQDGQLRSAPVLKAKLLQPDGRVVRRFLWNPGSLGHYQNAVKLPGDAATGLWQFEVDKPDGKTASYPFKVEEFLPERMKLEFAGGSQEQVVLSPKQGLSTPVKGEYLYGAAASGNRLSTQMFVSHWRSPIESLKNYQFGHILDDQGLGNTDLDDVFLDDAGKTILKHESQWQKAHSPLKVKLLSSLYESGGRPVTRSYDQLVWPAEALIGIRPEFKKDENPAENSRVRFDLVRANVKGQKLAASAVEVTLVKEDRQYFWEYSEDRGWHYQFSEQEFPVTKQQTSIAAGKHAMVELPVEWGRYRLEVVDTVNDTKSSLRFFAGDDWYSDRESGGQSSRPDVVGLELDKPRYSAGEKAKLTINSPHAGEALILVESDESLWTHRQAISKSNNIVEIPVDPKWERHDIHISVVVLRPASKVASISPNRAFGLVHLALDREDRKLALDILSVEKSEPNRPLQVKVQLKNDRPEGSQHFVTIAAVDVGILSLTDFETPDPHKGFFERRRYNIENRDMYGSLIELNEYEKARLNFGGDGPSRGGKAPASDIQLVSLYSAPVQFDAKGEATVSLDIPDFNGRLRLMAVGFGESTFGHAESEVTIAAPIVTQLSMPRFIASGDDATLALDLHNLSGKKQSLQLEMLAEHPLSTTDNKKQLVLGVDEKVTLTFPVSVGYGAFSAKLNLKVQSEELQFEREWNVAIRPPYPLQKFQEIKQVSAGQTSRHTISTLKTLLPHSTSGVLNVSNQLDLGVKEQMNALLKYPYGCLEQTSSKAYPWLYASPENISRFQLAGVTDEKRLKNITEAFQQLESKQLSNGGFGLWSNRSREEHWLTAYVTDLMLDAESLGYPVQQEMKTNALKRLETYLREPYLGFDRYSAHEKHYRLAYRSYAAYVLSRVNRANLGQMRNLFDHQLEESKSGLPLVHLGLALLKQGDSLRGEKSIQKGLVLNRDPKDYLGDYGSVVRDEAAIIRLLIDHPTFGGQASEKLLPLAAAVSDKKYMSTQERNAIFQTAIALGQEGKKPWQAQLKQGENTLSLSQSGSYETILDHAGMVGGVAVSNLSNELLWSSLSIEGYPKQAPEPSSNGYKIERFYFDREGRSKDISELAVGELVVVLLRVSSEERMPDTLVVDLLPAGLELENQNLEHSIKLDQFKIDGKSIDELQSETEIIHQEFRDDRYVAAIDHGSYAQQNHLFYLARAVTPGSYQVPPPFVEDMYRPEKHAIGSSVKQMRVVNKRP